MDIVLTYFIFESGKLYQRKCKRLGICTEEIVLGKLNSTKVYCDLILFKKVVLGKPYSTKDILLRKLYFWKQYFEKWTWESTQHLKGNNFFPEPELAFLGMRKRTVLLAEGRPNKGFP